MRRHWTDIEKILKTHDRHATPCFLADKDHPRGRPVTARVRAGRVQVLIPREGAADRPKTEERRCRLTRDSDDTVTCWLGLPPAVTVAGLRALFKEEPCRSRLSRVTRLARHLADDDDVDDILDELESLRAEVEFFLWSMREDGRLVRRPVTLDDPVTDEVIRAARAALAPGDDAALWIMDVLESEGRICVFTDEELRERVRREEGWL